MKLLEIFNKSGKNAIVEADSEAEKTMRDLGYSEENKPKADTKEPKAKDKPKADTKEPVGQPEK